MSIRCSCVECIGYQHEQEVEPVEVIQEISPQDIIVWPNGHWEYRDNVEPSELEDQNAYEVAPLNSPRWIALREQCR